MKTWGLSRWGPLLAVLTLLVSAGVFAPGAQAQGKKVWGIVTDCVSNDTVGANVFLVDAQAQQRPVQTTSGSDNGLYFFTDPVPAYYKVRVEPLGYTHFTNETAVFRFDGTATVRRDLCVDPMPTQNRWLNLTVVDAQPTSPPTELVTFQEFAHTSPPENATERGHVRYDTLTYLIQLDTKALKNRSEVVQLVDQTHPLGITLTPGPLADYDYTQLQAFNGQIFIRNPTVRTELAHTINGDPSPPGYGYVTVAYTNVSVSSSLRHGQIVSPSFSKSGVAMPNPWLTLRLNNDTGIVNIIGNWTFQTDQLTATYSWRGGIGGATVEILDANRHEPISANLTTSPTGKAPPARVWSGGSFDVKVVKDTYAPALKNYNITTSDRNDTVLLFRGWIVRVVTVDDVPNPVLQSQGLTGVLITKGVANREVRILPGLVSDGQVKFYAPNGNYLLVVDANAKTAYTRDIIVTGRNQTIAAQLSNSPNERYTTAVWFANNKDWNNLTVWRNVTLLKDSAFPGIPNGDLRNLRWQLDLKFGIGVPDGALSAAELRAVGNYTHDAGPFYVVTNSLLTVNGRTYRSDANPANYTVNVYDGPGTNFTINTTARYTLADTTKWIRTNQSTYYVNVTTAADQNATVYQDNSYVINVPATYEMTNRTTTGNVTTRYHTNVTVDPGIDKAVPNPVVRMKVEKSLTGIARAEVEGPAGKVYVKESKRYQYKAWVANNTNIIFSANATTDRGGKAVNVKDANFTWVFKQENVTASTPQWGIWVAHNFTNVGDWFIVNLTVRQANPTNVTNDWINVTVDNVAPKAFIKTNRTTGDNPPPFTLNEDQQITFSGTDSNDTLYAGASETGLVREWSWDFDSDGKVDRTGSSVPFWNYSTPGVYNATLFVTDQVGHKSANATVKITAKDITPPSINFVILDANNSWKETSTIVENKGYWFNASQTSDNSLKHAWDNVNLTFKFQWGDGRFTQILPRTTPNPNATLNVTHTYTKFGSNYKLNISATDAAGNVGWLNRTMVVQANTTAHPDLSIIPNTLKVTPSNPEEGAQVTFNVNFTNAKGKADATQLQVLLSMTVGGKNQNQTITNVRWLDPSGNAITKLAAGTNATVQFTWTAPSVGNKSLQIKVWDTDEPDAWITSANEQTANLAIKEAGWKFWAIVGGFVFVVFGLPILYYVVRKVRAGEWQLRRRRKEGDEEEEEEEEEEEKERGGKKRL